MRREEYTPPNDDERGRLQRMWDGTKDRLNDIQASIATWEAQSRQRTFRTLLLCGIPLIVVGSGFLSFMIPTKDFALMLVLKEERIGQAIIAARGIVFMALAFGGMAIGMALQLSFSEK